MTRDIGTNIVAAGLAERCLVQVGRQHGSEVEGERALDVAKSKEKSVSHSARSVR